MKLMLSNGYPMPFPTHLSEANQEAINLAAGEAQLHIVDVTAVQQLHTVTVEFTSREAMERACFQTHWPVWSDLDDRWILEVPTSSDDGYAHPAWVTGTTVDGDQTAWCGFFLEA